eukprot:CAMPEP_0204052726 /NCGR_PEP_ID=MMETSP0360-20130528/125098_1 /ASSEMBLY_ACC=CAM_ASM_000342 /TAXON_ID=268821 /ORGANISM="Scrippsiella Hangoei, Strain SHTV-5" /LENGTH=57 /DNA_ID=CAMNT_0050999857 /DNA_START=251 /DNA_END=420 /DNA_ORIENTATION=+
MTSNLFPSSAPYMAQVASASSSARLFSVQGNACKALAYDSVFSHIAGQPSNGPVSST